MDFPMLFNVFSDERKAHSVLCLYRDTLQKKGITDENTIIKAAQFDFSKLSFVIYEILNSNPTDIIRRYFNCGSEFNSRLEKILCKNGKIDHVGIEVTEPLSIIINEMNNWARNISNNLFGNNDFHIGNVNVYPASKIFKSRFGVDIDIMRINIMFGKNNCLLELFEFHDNINSTFNRTPPTILSNENIFDRKSPINSRIFKDSIWHYAINVKSKLDIIEIHSILSEISATNEEMYYMPYDEILKNSGDNSFNTRIFNLESGKGFEFVTYD